MKTTIVGLILLSFITSTLAAGQPELDNRIRALTAKFEELQQKPDKRIPADILRRAKGVILLDRTKAGFIFAYQGGGGVALVKNPGTKKWSPVAFVAANEASLGFQIGGEQNFFAILLMNTNATRLLTEPNFNFGGEARGTAGNSSAGAEGEISSDEQPVLVFDDRHGLFGGAAIKGGAISPDEDANRDYYGRFVSMEDILFGKKVKTTEAASELASKLARFSEASAK